jgi:hypothetical protein
MGKSHEGDEHSVFREPHLQAGAKRGDPSEAQAERVLSRRPDGPDAHASGGHSVYDEPDIFPGRSPEVIGQDWSCGKCGYNLRGLPVGRPCPECGHREPYRPPPPEAASYHKWVRERLGRTSPAIGWYVAFSAAILGGPFAIFGALFETTRLSAAGAVGFFAAIVIGPAIEETLKVFAASYVIEVRPYLFRRVEQIQVATVGTAFLFAAIENVIYLHVYHPGAGMELAAWRWSICVALHVGCTLVATRGLIDVWTRTVTEFRPPRITQGLPALVLAIVIHGTYNGLALAYHLVF